MYKYSPSQKFFYRIGIHTQLPSDVIDVSEAGYVAAMSRVAGETFDVVNGNVVIVPVPTPSPAALLAAAKADKWAAVKAERDRRIQGGGYKVGTKWYHSDTFSRTQQIGLVMMGASIPANTPWKTMDGTTVTMTQTLAGQIFGGAAASDIAIFAAAEAHKAAMEASADPAVYDLSGGWPKAYGE